MWNNWKGLWFIETPGWSNLKSFLVFQIFVFVNCVEVNSDSKIVTEKVFFINVIQILETDP